MKKSDEIIVLKLIGYAEQILEFVKGLDFEGFSNDTKTLSASVFNLSQMGELVGKFSDAFLEQNSQIPWRKINGLRNRIVHGYDDIQLTMVWQVIDEYLPQLIKDLKEI